MRVEDRVRKTVVFIGKETPNRFVPLGTGFIGAVEMDTALLPVLITAGHVIDDYFSDGDVISIRANRNNGVASSVNLINSGGLRHSNKGNDLIVFPFPADISLFDYQMIPLGRHELEERMAKDLWSHCVGDEVATIGLYTSHYGAEKTFQLCGLGI